MDEKARRLYYQKIVYKICNILDKQNGGNIVCGTVEYPSTEVQDAVEKMATDLKNLTSHTSSKDWPTAF